MSKKRCHWAENSFPSYEKYHDEEWGVPVHIDRKHFEFLILEGAQAGLSWSTVLKKRSGYRNAFADFDPIVVADFPESMIEVLIQDAGIIRNRLKIKSAINNAKRFLEVQREFGTFDHYIWSFANHKTIHGHWNTMKEVPATSKISDALSKDLKKRGFSFVGSTVMYAHLQAVGILNDHTTDCFRYPELTKH
jgi:DNA-3-methyladenine glycosylase I